MNPQLGETYYIQAKDGRWFKARVTGCEDHTTGYLEMTWMERPGYDGLHCMRMPDELMTEEDYTRHLLTR